MWKKHLPRRLENIRNMNRELAEKILELVKEVSPIIFENAGPSCVQNGYCPEGKKGCGKYPTMKELLKSYEESHGRD